MLTTLLDSGERPVQPQSVFSTHRASTATVCAAAKCWVMSLLCCVSCFESQTETSSVLDISESLHQGNYQAAGCMWHRLRTARAAHVWAVRGMHILHEPPWCGFARTHHGHPKEG
jgi:hypothetical protein